MQKKSLQTLKSSYASEKDLFDLLHIKCFSSPPKENAYLTHICRDSGGLNRRGSKPGLELYSIPSEKEDPDREG